jgi:sterol desaturase/sphingolipid hydroxylase (fatty acid hydroxylase superfamily)
MSAENLFTFVLPWLIGVVTIIVLRPFELWFPKIDEKRTWISRLVPIVSISLIALVFTYSVMLSSQQSLIMVFNHFKIFSLAKLDLPASIIFVVGFLSVDLIGYCIHRLSHLIKPLWNIHAIHHADEHVTALSGLLHHPLEPLVAYGLTLLLFVLIGMPVIVVLIYALIAALHNAFSHANISIPRQLEYILRLVIVTPDMHRTHHSVDMAEGNSNFGQIFSFWDRIFRTYKACPALPESAFAMGLPASSRLKAFRLKQLLLLPFS